MKDFYQAILSRDARFDGKVFFGVKTTGIYCRPICPAKPKKENIEYFMDAAAAERAGYRPCLRCRPESAPASPAWIGKSATVQRALRLITTRPFHELDEDQFAEQLGVSARHLRRLFEDELGRTPKQIADTHRLNFARKLVVETALPITDIAGVAGFGSIRRFNEAFSLRFDRAPSALRKTVGEQATAQGPWIQLSLSYRPPLDWASLLGFHKGHQVHGIEKVDTNHYSRIYEIYGVVGAFTLEHHESRAEFRLRVATEDSRVLYAVVQRVRAMFDLDSDPLHLAGVFSDCEIMGALCVKYPGLRLPRAWSPFETSICSILGQLVSVEQAQRLVKQLIEAYGREIKNPIDGSVAFVFPTPEVLASASFSEVGTTGARKKTLREFSSRIATQKISLDSAQDPQSFRTALLDVPGIGPWTAEYIALRALGDTDAFPGSDLVLKRALEKHPKLDVERLSPWKGYVAIYLWKEYAKLLSKKKEKKS
jgi:AraC family transcriptional regulator of adaptative response / DNA-3-methyladenine glycosylase II